MAVKATWSFDHLPTGLVVANAATIKGLGIPGINFSVGGDPGGGQGGVGIVSGSLNFAAGFSSYYSGNSTYGGSINVPLSNVQDFNTRSSVIGFRYTPTGLALPKFCWLTTGGVTVALASTTDAFGFVSGTTYFVEIIFDRINSRYQVYINNVLKKTTFLDYTTLNTTTTLGLGLDSSSGNNSGSSCKMRDFIFIDDTQDASPCTRQGPGTARPAVLVAASAAGWVSSDSGTPLSDLTTPISTGLVATPTLTGPSSQTPIQGTFQTAADPNLKVVAATVLVSSSNPSSNNGVLKGSWALGGQTEQAGQVNYPDNTMQWSQPLISTQDPSGNAWTVANLQAAQFAATPAGS